MSAEDGSGREPRVAVIGGGINGAGVAWELARKGYAVVLYDKGTFGGQTSSATTKMIHGGLRYLERMHVALVRESLRERGWLLRHLPALVKPMEILLPIYRDSPRARWQIKAALVLYDLLAGRQNIGRHRALPASELLERLPLVGEGLLGGFSYWDAQVDDAALVQTVVASAVRDGAATRERTRVKALLREHGGWTLRTGAGEESRFDLLVNAAGPWMNQLLAENGLPSRYRLSLVRGSHLVLRQRIGTAGALLQSVEDRRVFFVLPWKEGTLVGTTEVVQSALPDGIRPSPEEIRYLLTRFNRYFRTPIGEEEIASTFAGARPLVGRAANPSAIGREYRVVRNGSVVNVFGGKMTTFMALARHVSLRVDNYFGRVRVARAPVFAPR